MINWGELLAVLSDRVRGFGRGAGGGAGSVAIRSALHPTRLETRTKESSMCASRRAFSKPHGEMKVNWQDPPIYGEGAHCRPVSIAYDDDEAEQERTRWDPKDGELCLSRTKSGETLMEVRSDSDVQIDRQTWV